MPPTFWKSCPEHLSIALGSQYSASSSDSSTSALECHLAIQHPTPPHRLCLQSTTPQVFSTLPYLLEGSAFIVRHPELHRDSAPSTRLVDKHYRSSSLNDVQHDNTRTSFCATPKLYIYSCSVRSSTRETNIFPWDIVRWFLVQLKLDLIHTKVELD